MAPSERELLLIPKSLSAYSTSPLFDHHYLFLALEFEAVRNRQAHQANCPDHGGVDDELVFVVDRHLFIQIYQMVLVIEGEALDYEEDKHRHPLNEIEDSKRFDGCAELIPQHLQAMRIDHTVRQTPKEACEVAPPVELTLSDIV